MTVIFYASAAIAVISALLVVTRANAMHALIALVTLFLAIASVVWTLGAPFAAALQVVIYAGAIVILFVFAVMVLNLGRDEIRREREWMSGWIWFLPIVLTGVLIAQFVVGLSRRGGTVSFVGPKPVGMSMFTTYLIGVELASLLLLAGLIAAFHFGAFLGRPEIGDE